MHSRSTTKTQRTQRQAQRKSSLVFSKSAPRTPNSAVATFPTASDSKRSFIPKSMTRGNANVVRVIEDYANYDSQIVFQKVLDRMGGPTLYTNAALDRPLTQRDGENQMLTSWTHKEQTTKRRPTAAMRGVCLGVGRSLSPANIFDGRLGQATSIDSRHLRH